MTEPSPLAASLATPTAGDQAAARYLAELNQAQLSAVEAMEGPVLVLAGAGTGKTRVLTTRLAHILVTGRAWPSQVLAVTFTNKAAREMGERVSALIGRGTDDLWIGTFHSMGARILRRHAELAGLKSNFTILDADDQQRLMKQVMEAADVDTARWPPRGLLSIVERWKDRGLTPAKVSAAEVGEFAMGRALELYRAYQQRLATLNACDFSDLLLGCIELFTKEADVLADYQRHFKYILVDEYQDTNVAQYLWLRLLAQGHRNLCCVGDDDQSIYSWRGAEIGNILRFESDFPGATVVRLERNYRSSPEILAAASGLIANNDGRLGKTLWTERPGGESIRVQGVWDGEAEAAAIAGEIEVCQHAGDALDGIAVLVRASFQMREFEERFIATAIPYRVVGGPRFYERREVRDAIAYLRIIHQPGDDLAFDRIVNLPRRGIGNATLRVVHLLARGQSVSLTEAARRLVESDDLSTRARNALGAILADFDRWRRMAGEVGHVALARLVLDESGYTAMWQNDKAADAPGRLENLKELVGALEEFENLGGFLEHVSLVMEVAQADAGEMVSLMTLHAAKGLEFDTVFLPGWEEGVFPNQRSMDEGGTAALEEERRLAYVGLTRARNRALVYFAANRRVYNQWQSSLPSRFIDELPSEQVEMVSAAGLYGGTAGGDLAEETYDYAQERSGRGAGYERLRAARSRRGLMIDAKATVVKDGASGSIAIGMRVFHQKFGYGKVLASDGDKLEIAFEKSGTKKVMSSFVEPT